MQGSRNPCDYVQPIGTNIEHYPFRSSVGRASGSSLGGDYHQSLVSPSEKKNSGPLQGRVRQLVWGQSVALITSGCPGRYTNVSFLLCAYLGPQATRG